MKLMRQLMQNMLFINYAVQPTRLRSLVPAGLELDTVGGVALVSVVCFTNSRLKVGLLPISLPSYNQINCRTYVNAGEGPAVYFLSMAVGSRLIRAGAIMLGLPLRRAYIEITTVSTGGHVQLLRYVSKSPKTHWLQAEIVVSTREDTWPQAYKIAPEFITERQLGYVSAGGGSILKIIAKHDLLNVRPVLVERIEAPLLASLGVIASDEPAHLDSVFYVQEASFITRLSAPRLIGCG
jgi:uncharacterized protein YqjF (DUF2071 family)